MNKPTEITDYQRKRRRLRALCSACAICVVIFVGGIALHVADIGELQSSALQQQYAQESADEPENSKVIERQLYAPNLVSLLGHTLEESIALLGDGAQQTAAIPMNQQGSNVRTEVYVVLTHESAGSNVRTPTVTLSLDADGTVIRAGFTTNMTLLGYGFLSFADAVGNIHVVENTLKEAGLTVPAGSAVLPESKAAYTTYDNDGVTVALESCTFEGQQDQGGVTYLWESTLTFDYTLSNARSNLAYTTRTISVTVGTSR